MSRARGEDGTVTAFVTVCTVAALLASGLVLDGGRILAARREAFNEASAAARAGAQAVDLDALRQRRHRIDPPSAVVAAQSHLRQHGHEGSAFVQDGVVHVRVDVSRATPLLGLVGIDKVTVSEHGRARLVQGISEANN